MGELRDNDAYDFHYLVIAQRTGNEVGTEIMLCRITLYLLAALCADTRIITQGT